MADIPQTLKELLDDFAFVTDRNERAALLIEMADKFQEVPPAIAVRPFAEEHHVLRCESDAYVWAVDAPGGTLKYYFAVENPQGLSARAMAAIIDETLSGQPPEQVAAVPPDVIYTLFGKDISMGKGQGLMGMLAMVKYFAREKAGLPHPQGS